MRRFREVHPICYSLFAMGIFILVLYGAPYLIQDLNTGDDFLLPQVAGEFVEALLMLILIIAGGLGYVLKRQGDGFGSGVMAGAYFVVVGTLVLLSNWALYALYEDPELSAAAGLDPGNHLLSKEHIILFLILMLLVGIAEEFLYRGIVAESLIQYFGSSRGGILKASILTGILFGGSHMVNARSTGLVSASVQAISACVLGIVLTLAFYISGNLWSVVFLHAYVDFSGMFFNGGVYGNGSMAELVESMQYSWINLIGTIPYFIVILVLTRRKNVLRIQRIYGSPSEINNEGSGFHEEEADQGMTADDSVEERLQS